MGEVEEIGNGLGDQHHRPFRRRGNRVPQTQAIASGAAAAPEVQPSSGLSDRREATAFERVTERTPPRWTRAAFTYAQDEAALGRGSGLEVNRRERGHRDLVAHLANAVDLERRRPVGLRLAGDFDAGDALQPRAHPDFGAVGLHDLGQERRLGIIGLVRSRFRAHVLQDGVERAAGLEKAQRLLHEQGKVLRVGKAAHHVGDDVKPSRALPPNIPQPLAEQVLNLVRFEAGGGLMPLSRSAVLYRHGDRFRLPAGAARALQQRPVVFRGAVVQYRPALTRADVEPPVVRARDSRACG